MPLLIPNFPYYRKIDFVVDSPVAVDLLVIVVSTVAGVVSPKLRRVGRRLIMG